MNTLRLTGPQGPVRARIQLPASKSESNRALIISALSQGRARVHNLSEAADTQTLQRLLAEAPDRMDVGHAGTAMRFLTAFQAFQARDVELTGSARMQQRPIGPLVDALRHLGAEIHYLAEDGYPPLLICGRNARFRGSEVSIPGDVSSQYISALLMIAPTLPDGLTLHMTGTVGSWPYIRMTLDIMSRFGIAWAQEGPTIRVARQHYRGGDYAVEADWSAASYWYCIAALAPEADIALPGLRKDSLQGDQAIAGIMAPLGVTTTWAEDGIVLRKSGPPTVELLEWNFRDCPDLAQGVFAAMAALGVRGRFTGLESLRIKETDRIAALQNELGKFGATLAESAGVWELGGNFRPQAARIATYDDHRMAMALAPLALTGAALEIEDPAVVGKSYPRFWDDLRRAGFQTESPD